MAFLYNLAKRGTTLIEYFCGMQVILYPTVIETNPSILSGSSKLTIFNYQSGPTVLVSL